MVAIKPADFEGLLRRRENRYAVILVYGPDTGLVAERSRALAEAGVDDPNDPFQLTKIDGETLAGDPARLIDEASTLGLFGGRRSIWVRPTSKNIASAVEPVLTSPEVAASIVIEAGDLSKSSPLRTLAERSPRAAAVPCYADDDRTVSALIDERLKQTGLAMAKEVKSTLVSLLGGDRLASRAELDKLFVYAAGTREITQDDVDAVLSDVSALALDEVVDAAFTGDSKQTDMATRRLQAEGVHASVMVGAMLRHALALLSARADIEAGQSIEVAVENWRGLYFRRKPAATKALRLWTGQRIIQAIERLDAVLLQTRQKPDIAQAITSRAILQIASAARRTAAG